MLDSEFCNAHSHLLGMNRTIQPILAALFAMIITGCGPDELTRVDNPITYAEAKKRKDINFPFPASSHDIYYGVYGNWQEFTLIVRFDATLQDCTNAIRNLIAFDDAMMKRTSSYPRSSFTHIDPVDTGSIKSAPWFAPNMITNGIYTGENGSHTPEIWVDLDKGRFYFKETD